MKNIIALICGLILMSAATVASAAISEQDLDRLGKDLTPVGAEKAANAADVGDFVAGLVRSEAVVYYLVVSAMALTLNASYLQWRR